MDMKETAGLDTSALSVLLRQAIGDMDERLGTGHYVARTDVWHQPQGDSPSAKCEICLAGATLARYDVALEESLTTSDLHYGGFPLGTVQALHAIDLMRMGLILSAYRQLHEADDFGDVPNAVIRANDTVQKIPEVQRARSLGNWTDDRKAYLKMANIVEGHGL